MKKLSYLTISILLHGTLMGLLAYLSKEDGASKPIQLELVSAKDSESSILKPKKHSRRLGEDSAGEKGKTILIAAGASFNSDMAAKAGNSPFATALNDNQLYSAAEGNLFGENDNWAFHQQVFKEVDSELVFDAILARYNHFGTVFLEFSVDQKGYLLEKTLRASAPDAILKVHAVRALRRALDKEFEPTKRSVLEKPVVFRAKFEFTHENADLNFKKQNAFSDPIFVFRRATRGADVSTYRPADQGFDNIGDLFDYEQTIKKMKNRQRNKVLRAGDFDPFAHYKADPAYVL